MEKAGHATWAKEEIRLVTFKETKLVMHGDNGMGHVWAEGAVTCAWGKWAVV